MTLSLVFDDFDVFQRCFSIFKVKNCSHFFRIIENKGPSHLANCNVTQLLSILSIHNILEI